MKLFVEFKFGEDFRVQFLDARTTYSRKQIKSLILFVYTSIVRKKIWLKNRGQFIFFLNTGSTSGVLLFSGWIICYDTTSSVRGAGTLATGIFPLPGYFDQASYVEFLKSSKLKCYIFRFTLHLMLLYVPAPFFTCVLLALIGQNSQKHFYSLKYTI